MRRAECAASRDTVSLPSRSRSNGTPYESRSRTRSGASRAIAYATASSTMPAPAATVSATCFSTESPGAIAAAMPPCAQAEEAPSPIGAAASTVTGRGARRSAVNSPARPPPRMRISSVSAGAPGRTVWVTALSSVKCLGHRVGGHAAEHLDAVCRAIVVGPAGRQIETVCGLGAVEVRIADAALAHLVLEILQHCLADAGESRLRSDIVELDLTGVAEGADAEDRIVVLDHVHVGRRIAQPAHQVLGRLVGRPALDEGTVAAVVRLAEARDRFNQDAAHRERVLSPGTAKVHLALAVQLFKLTIRSTDRRARSAIMGST